MTNIEENEGSTVIKQNADYQPPKSWRTWLIGRPLSTADAPDQTIGKVVGLAVFASDALSSSAYSTQEVLVVLALAGVGAFHYCTSDSSGNRSFSRYSQSHTNRRSMHIRVEVVRILSREGQLR